MNNSPSNFDITISEPTELFQVNTYTSSVQSNSSVAALSDGGWVVTWQSLGQDTDSYGIFGQRYNSIGNPIGNEFQVNSYITSSQHNPSTLALTNGGWVVIWESFGQDGGSDSPWDSGVFAQRYDMAGNKLGEEIQVNTYIKNSQFDASASSLSGGGWVATWTTFDLDGDGYGNFGQIFDNYGTPVGDEFQVNSNGAGDQRGTEVVGLADGSWVVTWLQHELNTFYYDLYYKRYDEAGNQIGDEFKVNTFSQSTLSNSSLTALADGGWLATWLSDVPSEEGRYILYGQRYNNEGNGVGNEFQVISFPRKYSVEIPSVEGLFDGGWVVLFNAYNNSSNSVNGISPRESGYYGQRYSQDGTPVGDVFRIMNLGENSSVAALVDGGWVATLNSWEHDIVQGGISGRRYDSEGSTVNTFPLPVPNTISGTNSDDNLLGTNGNDDISTLEGVDVVNALAGDDVVTLTADSTWGAGYSAKNVSSDSSGGTNEKIALDGFNRFSDVIDGGADIDTLSLTAGNDAFFIDDVYSDHHSSLTLSSTTQGIDSTARIIDLEAIRAGEGNDIVDLTSANFILTEAIKIYGEAGNDTLWGSNGNDTIDGGEDNDTLFGGAGDDILTGGTGDDVFQFTATSGSDVITDLSAIDRMELYYRAEDNHTNADLNLVSGVLTWNTSEGNNVSIDLSNTITSSDFREVEGLITFVEIV
jgi:hypothetical protein